MSDIHNMTGNYINSLNTLRVTNNTLNMVYNNIYHEIYFYSNERYYTLCYSMTLTM